jgi:redox-sensitive bicupin YhaK (pirin superfamily)
MSGPVSTSDAPAEPVEDAPEACAMEVLDGRSAEVGGFGVRRVLPRRPRRTVGAWCFVDHMGPGSVGGDRGLDIGPHPHIGLQTVTWLLDGAVLHRDSLGSEQVIRPGELNLMTAGHGIAHAEETTGTHTGRLHGVQLWVAQPAATRDGDAAFEHHAELPRVDLGDATATVLVGALGGARSPARCDTDHVGVDLELRGRRTVVPLDPRFEHALVALDGGVSVGGRRLEPGHLGYLGVARDELAIDGDGDGPVRVLLLGGVPFPEPVLMWWNYVARTRDEITSAHAEWTARAERFGEVDTALERIDVAGPPWSAA